MRINKEGEEDREVVSVEIERVYSPEGNFSLYQFHARSIENIEEVVAELRSQGLRYEVPDLSDKKYLLPKPKINFKDYGLPVTVYLAGPSPEVKIQISEN